MHTEMFKNPRTKEIYPYKSVRWDTLAPKKKMSLDLRKEQSLLPLNSSINTKWITLSEHMKLKTASRKP
jgi:hypothetical protein